MNEMLALGKAYLASQPFSQLMGTELLKFSEGDVELKIPIRAELMQQHGFVHGGVISYAVDNALTFVGGSVLGPDVVTSEFKINYVKPVMGDAIHACASVVHAGKNQAVCRCDLFASNTGEKSLCAVAQGTISRRAQSHSG